MMLINPMTRQVVNAVEGSHSDLRDQLQELLRNRFKNSAKVAFSPNEVEASPYIQDVFDDYVVYSRGSKSYKLGYSMSKGKPVLSEETPVQVRRVTTYEPIKAKD